MFRGSTSLLVLLLSLAGCSSDALFQCQRNDQCVSQGEEGVCQASGYCSFGDGTCDSGYRYADSAPPGLAGQCVEPMPQGSSSCGTAGCETGAPGTSSGSDPSSTSSGGTTSQAGSSSSSSSGDTSETSASSSSTGETGESSSSTTTGGRRCPEFVEEFGNGVVEEGPWSLSEDGAWMAAEVGDVLRLFTGGGAGVVEVTMSPANVNEGYVVAHLVDLPQGASFFRLGVASTTGESLAFLLTGEGTLSVAIGAAQPGQVMVGAPSEIWLEVYFDGTNVGFAYSVDGNAFTTIVDEPYIGDYLDASITLSGFSGDGDPDNIEVDDFEQCSQPFAERTP